MAKRAVTVSDFRRAELRRKLRRAVSRRDKWAVSYLLLVDGREKDRALRFYDKWSDIARILRRTLREGVQRRNE